VEAHTAKIVDRADKSSLQQLSITHAAIKSSTQLESAMGDSVGKYVGGIEGGTVGAAVEGDTVGAAVGAHVISQQVVAQFDFTMLWTAGSS